VTGYLVSHVLGEHSLSHFWGSRGSNEFMALEGETTTLCRHIGNQIPSDTASHPRTDTLLQR